MWAQSQTQNTHVGAQHAPAPVSPSRDSALNQFLAQARAGTDQFRERSAAIAAGYRRLGMDFPSMGEHWVNPGLVLEGHFDASRPAMLSYVEIEGKPVLTGVVYAIPLAPGEKPPAIPGSAGMWHEHNGTVDEESMLPEHHSEHLSASANTAGTRLAILHAWTGVSNPAGIFEAENWALPFARLGLTISTSFPTGAARALSLLTGGEEYYVALAGARGADSDSVAAALNGCARIAAPIAKRARAAGILAPADGAQLEDAWAIALTKIAQNVGQSVAIRLNGGHPIRRND